MTKQDVDAYLDLRSKMIPLSAKLRTYDFQLSRIQVNDVEKIAEAIEGSTENVETFLTNGEYGVEKEYIYNNAVFFSLHEELKNEKTK